MIARLGHRLSDLAQRWVPDPLVLAIGLTTLAAALALPTLGFDPTRVAEAWVDGKGGGRGIWSLLAFGMQMCLVLATGHALADTGLVRRAIGSLAALPTSTRSAAVLVSVVAMLVAWLNWGLGLIVGALLAKEVGRTARARGVVVHYPLVVAAGYTGLAVWHGGLSGSAPLKVTTRAQLADVMPPDLAARLSPMSLHETLGSTTNLIVGAACLCVFPAVLAALAPPDEDAVPAPATLEADAPPPVARAHPADRLNHSTLVVLFPVLLAVVWLASWVRSEGLGRLDPNVLNLAMLAAGLSLHGSVAAYVVAFDKGVRACSGIILQYPFYAGIMGIMAGSGMVDAAAGWLAGLGPDALAVATFYFAGLVNLFVPSGGGQWAVQGPIVMAAALEAGADPARIVLALAYGDQWTNLIQPFWALPLLGICQVKAADILGYTVVLLLAAQLCFVVPLWLG